MQYRYVVAFHLLGIQRPERDIDLSTSKVSATLTGDVDALLLDADLSRIVADKLLIGLPDGAGAGSLEELFAAEIEALRFERRTMFPRGAFAVLQMVGEVDDFDCEPQRRIADHVVSLCESPKKEIKRRNEPVVRGLIAALLLESHHSEEVRVVARSVTFVQHDDMPCLCYWPEVSAKLSGSSVFVVDRLTSILRNAEKLADDSLLTSSVRLLAQSLSSDSDPLLSFISAWSGLEVFVGKNFGTYAAQFDEGVFEKESLRGHQRVVSSIRAVTSGEADLLLGKFGVIALTLDESKAINDFEAFIAIRKARNHIAHGREVPIDSLPTMSAIDLLRKYLKLHLEMLGQRPGGSGDLDSPES